MGGADAPSGGEGWWAALAEGAAWALAAEFRKKKEKEVIFYFE